MHLPNPFSHSALWKEKYFLLMSRCLVDYHTLITLCSSFLFGTQAVFKRKNPALHMVHRLLKGIFNLLRSAIFGSLLKIQISWHAEICNDDFFSLGKRNVIYCEQTPYPHLGTEIGLYRKFPCFCRALILFLLGFIAPNSHAYFYFSVEICKTGKGEKCYFIAQLSELL